MNEPLNSQSADSQAPLEDLMAAMDVVDTLRHQQGVAEREFDTQARREKLLERLKELYSAQGIVVPEHVLQEGIDALEQERFQYQPIAKSWRTKIASAWVSRGRWGKPIGFLAVVGSLFYGYYFISDVLPEKRLQATLPQQIERNLAQIEQTAKNPDLLLQAQQNALSARLAIENEQYDEAQEILDSMTSAADLIGREYSLRVISKPNQSSGVWRVPPNNPNGRNYYLIVEALDKNNKVMELEILNQENNKRERTKQWGLRVSEQTFYKIAADKNDDGIIQNNQVGKKEVGFLKPRFNIPTTGATITKW